MASSLAIEHIIINGFALGLDLSQIFAGQVAYGVDGICWTAVKTRYRTIAIYGSKDRIWVHFIYFGYFESFHSIRFYLLFSEFFLVLKP